ncbi:MAG: 30S ribosomal protein S15 [Elusimicrobiales bacterium]|nr:30S ribosomal protein S15 [Elusimicrobiales bacterium]
MAFTKQTKQNTVIKYQAHPTDCGGTAVQVALVTERINYISSHLKNHPKDYAGERGLLKLVGQRKRLLTYLKEKDFAHYQKLIKQLEVRK